MGHQASRGVLQRLGTRSQPKPPAPSPGSYQGVPTPPWAGLAPAALIHLSRRTLNSLERVAESTLNLSDQLEPVLARGHDDGGVTDGFAVAYTSPPLAVVIFFDHFVACPFCRRKLTPSRYAMFRSGVGKRYTSRPRPDRFTPHRGASSRRMAASLSIDLEHQATSSWLVALCL